MCSAIESKSPISEQREPVIARRAMCIVAAVMTTLGALATGLTTWGHLARDWPHVWWHHALGLLAIGSVYLLTTMTARIMVLSMQRFAVRQVNHVEARYQQLLRGIHSVSTVNEAERHLHDQDKGC